MKIILTSDIDDIGLAGEVKTVKNGLARNYLIPRKLAIKATEVSLRDWRKKLEVLKEKREKTIAEAQTVADKINGTVIEIESKLSDGEKMFGSVSVHTIAEVLKERHGLEIEKRNILLEKNIKSIGRFEVPIRIKAHIKASVIVQITAEQDEEALAAAQVAEMEETQNTEEQDAMQTETEQAPEAQSEEEQSEEPQGEETEKVEEQTLTDGDTSVKLDGFEKVDMSLPDTDGSEETPSADEESKEEA
ncbi:MAG: 50S ribosomal protein L9 [Candidatus Mycalebacterium zealandia]|nr:MAG: 50S ribosomal protein L9 [Candidatus Mycalebacterium zealandia]